MSKERGKFGVPIGQTDDQELIARVKKHLGKEYLGWTAGQIQSSVDGDYGDPDPKSKAGHQALGDFTACGGSGPKRKA